MPPYRAPGAVQSSGDRAASRSATSEGVGTAARKSDAAAGKAGHWKSTRQLRSTRATTALSQAKPYSRACVQHACCKRPEHNHDCCTAI